MFQILVRTLIFLSVLFSAKAFAESPDYPLGPGDILRIQVFQNPDLTTETRVSESGSITFPLVGAVEVGGLSVASAENKLASALKKGVS